MCKTPYAVSVIITTRNRGNSLPENIESVLEQDSQSFEVIYVDDGSTDNTPEVLAKYFSSYPDKLKVVRTEGLGPGQARNKNRQSARWHRDPPASRS